MTDVSIIIVTYNTLSMTKDCLDSVFAKTEGISFEVIVVDNASTDGSKDYFSSEKRIKYVYMDENVGFGRANNAGVAVSEGRNILFLNSDTLLVNNAIMALSRFLDSHPEAGACGGNLFTKDGEPNYCIDTQLPSLMDEINLLTRGVFERKRIHFNSSGKEMRVKHIMGADLMVKASVIKECGAFDPSYFMYYEDTELCWRIGKAGYALYSVPEAKIIHFWRGTTRIDEHYELYVQRIEKSRKTYLCITHSKFYYLLSNFIRDIAMISKTISPSKEIRETWKTKRKLYHKIVRELIT